MRNLMRNSPFRGSLRAVFQHNRFS